MHIVNIKQKDKYALLVPLDPKAVSFSFGPNAIPTGLSFLAYFKTVIPHLFTGERVKAYVKSSGYCEFIFISSQCYSVKLLKACFRLLQQFGLKKGLKFLKKPDHLLEFILERLPTGMHGLHRNNILLVSSTAP